MYHVGITTTGLLLKERRYDSFRSKREVRERDAYCEVDRRVLRTVEAFVRSNRAYTLHICTESDRVGVYAVLVRTGEGLDAEMQGCRDRAQLLWKVKVFRNLMPLLMYHERLGAQAAIERAKAMLHEANERFRKFEEPEKKKKKKKKKN